MAELIHLFQPAALRDCEGCGNAHREPGTLCVVCRARRPQVLPVAVADAAASVIADLERLDKNRFPLADPIASVLKKARELYDAVGPRRDDPPGEIHYIEGEFWAHPADDAALRLGPFGSADLADDSLVARAAKRAAGEGNAD
jgi:hypothetical protein